MTHKVFHDRELSLTITIMVLCLAAFVAIIVMTALRLFSFVWSFRKHFTHHFPGVNGSRRDGVQEDEAQEIMRGPDIPESYQQAKWFCQN